MCFDHPSEKSTSRDRAEIAGVTHQRARNDIDVPQPERERHLPELQSDQDNSFSWNPKMLFMFTFQICPPSPETVLENPPEVTEVPKNRSRSRRDSHISSFVQADHHGLLGEDLALPKHLAEPWDDLWVTKVVRPNMLEAVNFLATSFGNTTGPVWYTTCHHLPSLVCKLGAKSHGLSWSFPFKWWFWLTLVYPPLLDGPKWSKQMAVDEIHLRFAIPIMYTLLYTNKYPHLLMVHPRSHQAEILLRGSQKSPRQRARSPVAIPPKGCSASGSA